MPGPYMQTHDSFLGIDRSSSHKPGEVRLPATAPVSQPPYFGPYAESLDDTYFSSTLPLSIPQDQSCFQLNTQNQLSSTYTTGQHIRKSEAHSLDPEISEIPPQKRQKSNKYVATKGSIIENEMPEVESQSECCSSCPSGPPCDGEHCLGPVAAKVVVSCTEDPCYQPGRVDKRPKMCLSERIRNQQARWDSQSNSEKRTANWENGSWNSQVVANPFEIDGRYANGPTIGFPSMQGTGHNMHSQVERYPEAIAPSMGVDTASYSPGAQLASSFQTSASPIFRSKPETMLHGTGGMFQGDHNGEWQDQSLNASPNMNCHWGGCDYTFVDQSQMFGHLHGKHFDPVLKYHCPVPSSECKEIIDMDPVEHLRNFHNWDQLTCPNSSCPEAGSEFCDPALLHNHFDQQHSIQPQEGLFCQWDWCNTAVENMAQLSDHLSAQHALNVPGIGEEEIDLNAPMTAGVSPVCATGPKLPLLPKRALTPKDDEAHGLTCQWETESGVCGVLKTGRDAAKELQDHVKKEHLAQLSSITGYICKWKKCNRVNYDVGRQRFSQRGKLERHIASHTTCKSPTAIGSQLNLTSTLDKCCECSKCGLKFSAPQALKQHMNLHNQIKPWKCRYCKKSFPQQSAKSKYSISNLCASLIC